MMGFFSNFIDNVKKKKAEMDDRRNFLNEVEENTKPFRRAAYMKQAIHDSVNEGIARAKIDSTKKLQKVNAPKESTGLMEGINNPYKYLEGHPGFKTTKLKEGKKKWIQNL